jgi:hypothetical protein
MKRKSVINIGKLPMRASRISEDALSNVFGGCSQEGQTCNKSCCNANSICVSTDGGRTFNCQTRSNDF